VPQQQAVHMTATWPLAYTRRKSLQAGGHPHMTVSPAVVANDKENS
jgi:hypothetical protein